MEAAKVRNPVTGRMITVGGTTYNQLITQGYQLAPPVIPTTIPMPKVPVIPTTIPMPNVPATVPVIPTTITMPKVPTKVPVIHTTSPTIITMPNVPVSPVMYLGPVPTVGTFQEEINRIAREEEDRRVRVCGICREYYIDRWNPFTIPELSNLSKIVQACSECAELCDAKHYRAGITNAKSCQSYKTATAAGQKQITNLDTAIRMKGIQAAQAAGTDIGKFFPAVPK